MTKAAVLAVLELRTGGGNAMMSPMCVARQLLWFTGALLWTLGCQVARNASCESDTSLLLEASRLDRLIIGAECREDYIELPKLRSVGAILVQDSNVRRLSFLVLEEAGAITIAGNHNLTHLAFPALAETSELRISHAASIEAIAVPRLIKVGQLELSNTNLGELAAPAMTTVGHLLMVENPKLMRLAFDRLEMADTFAIGLNESLTSISVPALRSIGKALGIQENPSLSHCVAERVLQRVLDAGRPPPEISIGRNNPEGTCSVSDVGH